MKVEEYTFKKKDGTIRTIVGTQDFKSVEKEDTKFIKPKNIRKTPKHLTVFWDVRNSAWKRFITKNLISKREIKNGQQSCRIENKDFYNKRVSTSTILKRQKTPYFVLSILNAFGTRTRKQLIDSLEYIATQIDISKNQKRNVQRILVAFKQNNIIEFEEGNYSLTKFGEDFLSQNIE